VYNFYMAEKQESVQTPTFDPVPKIEPEKELFSWRAPARPFKKRGKEFWTKIIISASLFSVIVYLAEGAMPVILIIAVIFLFYIMSNVEPEEIGYKITNRGIKIADKLTDMALLNRFWFTKRLGTELLVFEILTIPGRLEVVINSKDQEKIRKVLSTYITEEEVPPTNTDRLASWFSKNFLRD